MIKLQNESSMVEVKEVSNIPYYTIGTNWNVYGMTPEAADEIIALVDSGDMDEFTNLTFYLYDIYADDDDLVEGFSKLIHHFIYKRQWMIEHGVSVFCSTNAQREALGNLIEESSKAITNLDGDKWPKNDRTFIDRFDPKQDMRSGIPILNDTPIYESIMTSTETNYTYDELYLTPTGNVDVELTTGTELTEYVQVKYDHLVFVLTMRKDVSKFTSGSTITRRVPGGKILIDVYHPITEPENIFYSEEELSGMEGESVVITIAQ